MIGCISFNLLKLYFLIDFFGFETGKRNIEISVLNLRFIEFLVKNSIVVVF